MGERLVLGETHIEVTDQELNAGYQAGYQRFLTHFRTTLLTDNQIYGFLATNIYDCFHSDRYRAGYILGWCAALHALGRPGATVGYYVARQNVQVTE